MTGEYRNVNRSHDVDIHTVAVTVHHDVDSDSVDHDFVDSDSVDHDFVDSDIDSCGDIE